MRSFNLSLHLLYNWTSSPQSSLLLSAFKYTLKSCLCYDLNIVDDVTGYIGMEESFIAGMYENCVAMSTK